MSTRANISPGYRWRLGLIGMVCTAFGLWALYDGAVAYPHQQRVATEFLEYKDTGRRDEWPDYARSQGWSIKDPGKPKKDGEIYLQYGMAAAVGPIGLLYLFGFFRSMNRWVDADENGLITSWGQQVPFEGIKSLDKNRWRSKGIAVVNYEDHGTGRRLMLDDWKFERPPTEALVRLVESHLDPEHIMGGEPEPEPGQEAVDSDPDAVDDPAEQTTQA